MQKSLSPLLIELCRADFRVDVTDGLLTVSPKARITPELRQRIIENKAALIAELTQGRPVDDGPFLLYMLRTYPRLAASVAVEIVLHPAEAKTFGGER